LYVVTLKKKLIDRIPDYLAVGLQAKQGSRTPAG
jgi:hypothetical protein